MNGSNEFINCKKGIKMFNEQVILKSKQFMDTEQAKSMKYRGFRWSSHFYIAEYSPIMIEHIQSIKLY